MNVFDILIFVGFIAATSFCLVALVLSVREAARGGKGWRE